MTTLSGPIDVVAEVVISVSITEGVIGNSEVVPAKSGVSASDSAKFVTIGGTSRTVDGAINVAFAA